MRGFSSSKSFVDVEPGGHSERDREWVADFAGEPNGVRLEVDVSSQGPSSRPMP